MKQTLMDIARVKGGKWDGWSLMQINKRQIRAFKNDEELFDYLEEMKNEGGLFTTRSIEITDYQLGEVGNEHLEKSQYDRLLAEGKIGVDGFSV